MRRAGRGLRTARACDRRYLRERNRGCSLDGQFAGESAQPVRHGVGSAATLLAIRESSYGGFVRLSRWARAGNSVPKAPLRRRNCVRWYLRFSLSLRDVEAPLAKKGCGERTARPVPASARIGPASVSSTAVGWRWPQLLRGIGGVTQLSRWAIRSNRASSGSEKWRR